MYGGDLAQMTPKTYWEHRTWKFPCPSTPPVPNGDDGDPFVNPYGLVVV